MLYILYSSIYKVYTVRMKTKIQKWGNSLGVRLPKNITEQKSLHEGLSVSILLKDNQIVIEPAEDEIFLKDLLLNVSDKNLHSETDWSDARGNEIW